MISGRWEKQRLSIFMAPPLPNMKSDTTFGRRKTTTKDCYRLTHTPLRKSYKRVNCCRVRDQA